MEIDEETHFIQILIENVEQRKCLYDKRNPFYFNRNIKEKAWKEIGEICNKSGVDCKHKWKLLRERFCKEVKRMEAPSGSGMSYLEEWSFMQPMMFLKSSLAPRRTRDNDAEQDSVVECIISGDNLINFPTSASPTPPKKSRTTIECLYEKLNNTIQSIEERITSPPEEMTADEAFMKTVVCLMKDLPVGVKDDFQASVMENLYRLRRKHRNDETVNRNL